MRFYANEKKVVTVSELKGIQCNKCGNIFEPNYGDSSQQFEALVGYNSNFNSNFKFDLCEKCLLEFVMQFEIVPDNFMCGYTTQYKEDSNLHQEKFNNWKTTGEWDDTNDNPQIEYINPDISYDNEFDFNESDQYIDDFYNNQNMDTLKPLPQATLKIVK